MTKKNNGLNQRIADEKKYLSACQDTAALLTSAMNIMPVLIKSMRRMYPTNDASKDLCVSARVVAGDLASMRTEVEALASDLADTIYKLNQELKKTQEEK